MLCLGVLGFIGFKILDFSFFNHLTIQALGLNKGAGVQGLRDESR